MRIHAIWLGLALAVASFAHATPSTAQSAQKAPAQLASAIGKVVSVSGAVTIERANAAVIQANAGSAPPVKDGDLVYRGDVVATGPDGKVSLVFADGTAFNVSNNARMELTEFVYNPDGRSNSSMFSLVKGAFTFVAGKIAKTGNMRLDTPVATMGIRGTTPHVVVSEDGTVKFSTLVEEKRR